MKISEMGILKMLDAIEHRQNDDMLHPLTCANCNHVKLIAKTIFTNSVVSVSSQKDSKIYLETV
jgi:hypothetical protein